MQLISRYALNSTFVKPTELKKYSTDRLTSAQRKKKCGPNLLTPGVRVGTLAVERDPAPT